MILKIIKETSNLNNIKEVFVIIESVIKIIAIIFGGWWSYRLFVKNRLKYPKAKIEHKVFHKKITDDKILLHVDTTILNTGNVLISIVSGVTRVQQMIPTQNTILNSINEGKDPVSEELNEINWPLIQEREYKRKKGELEIEPGENDQICYDFIIDSDVQTVVIYSYYKNINKYRRDLGWHLTTKYDLK